MSRSRISLVLLLCMVVPFAVYVNGRIINKEIERWSEPARTEEARYERRLQPLKEFLPEHGVIGYVTDERVSLYKELKDFYLAQYMLCPRLLVRDIHYPSVIGVYYEIAQPDRTASQSLTLVKDFGYGIELYQGKQR